MTKINHSAGADHLPDQDQNLGFYWMYITETITEDVSYIFLVSAKSQEILQLA